jgi:hypothetical protein
MTRKRVVWLAAAVALAVLVAVQVVVSSGHRTQFIARADIPTVTPGIDVLVGIAVRRFLDRRHHRTGRTQRLRHPQRHPEP